MDSSKRIQRRQTPCWVNNVSIYQNIINSNYYTLRYVEAIPVMVEATPYMTGGEVLKYPAVSAEANYFVKLSSQAIAAYENARSSG